MVEVLARITGGDHHLKGGTELFVGESLVLLWLTRRSSTGAARLLGSTARSPLELDALDADLAKCW